MVSWFNLQFKNIVFSVEKLVKHLAISSWFTPRCLHAYLVFFNFVVQVTARKRDRKCVGCWQMSRFLPRRINELQLLYLTLKLASNKFAMKCWYSFDVKNTL